MPEQIHDIDKSGFSDTEINHKDNQERSSENEGKTVFLLGYEWNIGDGGLEKQISHIEQMAKEGKAKISNTYNGSVVNSANSNS